MPRRRMIDPSFWDDHCIAKLTRDERLFLLGAVGNGDDEGRLKGHAAYLKASIFMYDDDLTADTVQKIKESCLDKMNSWPKNHPYRIIPYQNSDEDYLFFPSWYDHQKPSHPTTSKLPSPPETLPISSRETREEATKASSESPENNPNHAGDAPSQSSLGQSSLGKVSKGKVRGVQEDFTKFLNNEKDLTDFVTTTLENYLPRGPTWMVEVLQELWAQTLGQRMSGKAFEITLTAVKEYPPPVLAIAYVKATKHGGGKYNTAKYLQKILKEKAEEHAKE